MEHLSPAQRVQLQETLEASRREILGRISSHLEDLPLPEGEPRDLSDMATEDEHRMLLTKLDTRERARLVDIAAALVRIREGSYGICEDSDEEIPFAHLLALPTTRRSAEAQQAHEQREQRARHLSREQDPSAY